VPDDVVSPPDAEVERAELESQVLHTLGRLARRGKVLLEQHLAPYGVTAQQWGVLVYCCERGEATPNDVAASLDIDSAGVTRLLDRLEAKGLIRRHTSTIDRRSIVIEPTAAGQALAPQLPSLRRVVHEGMLSQFSDADLRHLVALLRRMEAACPSA
jgi:DNA-binding MarR family transcriptional regulator